MTPFDPDPLTVEYEEWELGPSADDIPEYDIRKPAVPRWIGPVAILALVAFAFAAAIGAAR